MKGCVHLEKNNIYFELREVLLMTIVTPPFTD